MTSGEATSYEFFHLVICGDSRQGMILVQLAEQAQPEAGVLAERIQNQIYGVDAG
jgi:hypothetical protein